MPKKCCYVVLLCYIVIPLYEAISVGMHQSPNGISDHTKTSLRLCTSAQWTGTSALCTSHTHTHTQTHTHTHFRTTAGKELIGEIALPFA